MSLEWLQIAPLHQGRSFDFGSIGLLPLEMLSGGITPRESMPKVVQDVMLAAPTTHFVELGQAILFRGAGVDVVWPQFLALMVIGSVFYLTALARFRKVLVTMA